MKLGLGRPGLVKFFLSPLLPKHPWQFAQKPSVFSGFPVPFKGIQAWELRFRPLVCALGMLIRMQTRPDLCLHFGESISQCSCLRRNAGRCKCRLYEEESVACVPLYKLFRIIVLEICTWWVPIEQIGKLLGMFDHVLGNITIAIDTIVGFVFAIIGIPSLPHAS